MPDLAIVDAQQAMLDDLTTLATMDLTQIVEALAGEDPHVTQDALREVTPEIVLPYAAQAGEMTSAVYLDDRDAAGINTPYPVSTAPVLPTEERLRALAGWATTLLFANPAATAAVIERLAGGVTRAIYDVHRDTVWDLGANDSVPVRYQRMAQPGCCAFCAMLASRGAAYASEASAAGVVGRGMPIPADGTRKRRGGQPQGIKARGPRRMGEDYHDHCRCVAVALHPGREQQMHSAAAGWLDIYVEARNTAKDKFEYGSEQWLTFGPGGRQAHSRSFWVDDRPEKATYGDEVAYKAVQSQILTEMRRIAAEDHGLAMS